MSNSSSLTSPLLERQITPSSSSDQPGDADPSSDRVAGLKAQLQELQNQLTTALTNNYMSNTPDIKGDEGYVDVEFVKTKPTFKDKLLCRKDEKVKTILHDFTAEFPEGCVTALMGPSGAGKTTLLDFVTGMLGSSVKACGEVRLPDNDSYVPQDDRLHSFYTCQEYMEHYARLSGMKKLFDCYQRKGSTGDESGGKDVEAASLTSSTDELIAHILEEVGLSAQKDTPVGGLFKRGLSGGQKRRLSVALEALSSPMNLFLDEPTSGLDSESALDLMQYLKTYARKTDPITGKRHRVIITIHQPSSRIWELIDNVVILAKGRLIYQGSRTLIESFYASCGHPVPLNFNPADHFIEALSDFPKVEALGERGADSRSKEEMWSDSFRTWMSRDKSRAELMKNAASRRATTRETMRNMNDAENHVVRVDPEKFSKRKKMKKVSVSAIELCRRSFTNLFKTPIILGLRLGIYGGMSLFIGALFFRLEYNKNLHAVIVSRTALLYFVLAFGSSMSVAGIPFSMVERGIVEKEVRNKKYHPMFYHISQTLVSVPVCLILAILVGGIIKGMTGLGGDNGVDMLHSELVLFVVFLCADAVSMFIGHVAPELVSAICIATGIFGIMTIMMGFIILPSAMPIWIRWLYYVPFMTYGFRSLMQIEYGDNNLHVETKIYANGTDASIVVDGNGLLKFFEIHCTPIRDIGILVAWVCLMHLISIAYLLWYKWKSKRTFVYSDK